MNVLLNAATKKKKGGTLVRPHCQLVYTGPAYHMPRVTSMRSPASRRGSCDLPSLMDCRLYSFVFRNPLGLRRATFTLILPPAGAPPADKIAWVNVMPSRNSFSPREAMSPPT